MLHTGPWNGDGSLIVKSCSSHCPAPPLPRALSQQMAEQLMTLAYENGINLFDTAEVYAAGKWVRLVQMSSQGKCYQAANAISNAKLRVWIVCVWGFGGGMGGREEVGGVAG